MATYLQFFPSLKKYEISKRISKINKKKYVIKF